MESCPEVGGAVYRPGVYKMPIITQNNITLDARTIRYAERTKCGTKGNYITGENAVIQSQGLHGKIVLGIAKELTRGI